MSKPTIGVFFGSRSAEHDVSIVTAIASIIKPLQRSGKYHVVPIYIAKDGRWFSDPVLNDIEIFRSARITDFLERSKPIAVQFDGGLTLLKPGLKNQKIKIDVAFPATHGTYGEDGSLMGLLRMANVPFVGCDMPASVIAMDKVLAKQATGQEGIAAPKWDWCTADEVKDEKAILKKLEHLQFPVFVKPAHLGSSIGITRVTSRKDLLNALEVAAHYDEKIIIEEGVPNLIEVTVPVKGNAHPQVALVERPLSVTDEGVFDFETKYMHQGKGGKNIGAKQGAQGYSELPAKLEGTLYQQAEAMALAVYKALGCSGTARVDLLIDSKAKQLYFNEVNPLPGSLYTHNWRAAGVTPVQLVTELIDLAIERHQERQRLATTFSTNYLQQF